MLPDLPITSVLPQIRAALAVDGAGVLIAPPGAGNTTAVAPDLLAQTWCTGQIILTSPRRVAARAAAERMAEMLGEKPGETVGYITRLDSKVSAKTRILVVTEGSVAFLTIFLGRQCLVGRQMTVIARHRVTSFAGLQAPWRVVIGGRGRDGWCSSGRYVGADIDLAPRP